jgi:hypothetical protein
MSRLHVALFFIALTPVAGATSDKTQQIVAEVSAASGGLRAAQAIPALAYRLHIKEATYEADADYLVDRAGRVRIDVYVEGKRVFTECFDGKTAWEMDAKGVTSEQSSDGTAALWHGTQYPGQILDIAELGRHGHHIESTGKEKVSGVEYDVLRLTMSDGFITYRFVDPKTHLITRGRDVRAAHPDIDPKKVEIETTWSDFRAVDGVMRPFVSTEKNLNDGKWIQTATVKSIKAIQSLPDRIFVKGATEEPIDLPAKNS